MARRKRVSSKLVGIKADRLYQNHKIAKLTNMIMHDGKHSVAYSIVCGALDLMYDHHMKKATTSPKAVEKIKKQEDEGKSEEGGFGSESVQGTTEVPSKLTKQEVVNDLFTKVIEAASPRVEVKSRRIGGANYQVPVEVRTTRKLTLTFRWIIRFARARSGKSMVSKLANELIDTLEGKSNTLREKENIHRMAMANQAFANFKR